MRAAQRETAIRAAALRIFRRKGYHAASMQEIADAVVWLASEKASYVTGVALPIDGGYSAA